jgi:V8-like Glu-specific endopeptidase
LKVTFADGQTAIGTGAMVDAYHVLTAAHILYSAKDGGYAVSVEAIPDAQGSSAPFGVAFGTYERVDPSWPGFSTSNAGLTSSAVTDIGLVTLNEAIGLSTGYFFVTYGPSDSFYNGATFQTAGYPNVAGLSGPQMFFKSGESFGTVSNDGIAFSQTSLRAFPGQSGSPIWQTSTNGIPLLYGLLTGASGMSASSQVYGARITPAVYEELVSWDQQDYAMGLYPNGGYVALQHAPVTYVAPPSTGPTAILALDFMWNPWSRQYEWYEPAPVYFQSNGDSQYNGPAFEQGYASDSYWPQYSEGEFPYIQWLDDLYAYGANEYSMELAP